MNNHNFTGLTKQKAFTGIFDLAAITFIYFVPALSHLLSVPLYLAEPMRIILIFSLLYTTRRNAYLLAFTLPLFSFLVSAHPVFLKTLLITAELTVNVWLFFILLKILKHAYKAIFISIAASKVFYYLVKFIFIRTAVLNSELISTPVYIQLILTVALSVSALILIKNADSD